MKTVKVVVDHELRIATVKFDGKREYKLTDKNYGFRALPAILELARFTKYYSGHKKGDRTPYVDSVCGGDVPASFTYMFKDKVCHSPHKGRESCKDVCYQSCSYYAPKQRADVHKKENNES